MLKNKLTLLKKVPSRLFTDVHHSIYAVKPVLEDKANWTGNIWQGLPSTK